MLPCGLGLHSSHTKRMKSERLWNQVRNANRAVIFWQPFKFPGMNLSREQFFHIFQFLLWFKWAVPNMWITLSGIIQPVERETTDQNSGKPWRHFWKFLLRSRFFLFFESWILLLIKPVTWKIKSILWYFSNFSLSFLCWFSLPTMGLFLVSILVLAWQKKKIHSGFSVTKTLTNFLANQYKILKDAVQLLKIIAN